MTISIIRVIIIIKIKVIITNFIVMIMYKVRDENGNEKKLKNLLTRNGQVAHRNIYKNVRQQRNVLDVAIRLKK